jgi:hypothetical protein
MAHQTIAEQQAQPVGIRGWLLLPAFGTLISPLLFARNIVELGSVLPLINDRSDALFAFLVGELVACAALLALSIVAIVLLLKHHRKYPALFIGLLLATVILAIVDHEGARTFGNAADAGDTGQLIRAILAALIWIPYMGKSKRVQNTFVR